jgi:hypothetical protein
LDSDPQQLASRQKDRSAADGSDRPKRSLILRVARVLATTVIVVTLPFVLCGGCLILFPMGDWFWQASGKVVDPNGDPIEGARVSLFFDDLSWPKHVFATTTEGEYFFEESGAPPGLFGHGHHSILLVIDSSGFKKVSTRLDDRHWFAGVVTRLQPLNEAQWRIESAQKKARATSMNGP